MAKFSLLDPQVPADTTSTEPKFLAVDFLDLDIVKVTGQTTYNRENGFWYVKTRKGEWIRLEYANKEERDAIRKEIHHRVAAFEKRMGKKWKSSERVRSGS